ncbi:kinesin-like protein KIN-5C [Helianthus annuus]|nr:kinesin-like protein KIN-5C [Helianthus annuus]
MEESKELENHANHVDKIHTKNINDFHKAYESDEIQQKAHDTLQQKYMDYEPSGNTFIRCDPAVPSKDTIESLRAMPMETLLEEFRENHSFELLEVKDGKITPASQSPLSEIN